MPASTKQTPPKRIKAPVNLGGMWSYDRGAMRSDLIVTSALVMMTVLLWCSIYNRWTPRSWSIPLTYLSEPEKGDVIGILTGIKSAKDGHVWPFLFTNIPELGAPFVANWDDWPSTEKLLITVPGLVANAIGIFAAANLAVLTAQVLAAVSFYAACRLLGGKRVWSIVGAMAFAFSRFAFAHGLHHFTIAYYWHIPLCLVVCGWCFDREGLKFREPRFLFALLVAFLTGIQNVYYTNMFAQFVLFGGLIQWWRKRDWRAALPAAAVIGVAAGGFLLMNMNTFLYHLVHGRSSGAVVRAYKWLEIYALKIVDLLIPQPDHHLPLFAKFGAWHMSTSILPPGELPPTGYIGLVGIAAATWLLVVSIRRAVDRGTLPLEAWQILWILLYAEVGGLNCLMGSFGFQLFRATTRYSIFILCIVLMYAVQRLSLVEFKKRSVRYGAAIGLVMLALWDQTPPQVTAEELEETAAAVASDRNFTEKMEEHLPPNAMVFQIPIMEFPESPVPGVGSYDHFRPYLYSHHLRFSFGSDKGRPREKWQQGLAGMSLGDVVGALERYGFAAIYVNRNGFPDKGEGLVKAFKNIDRGDMLESEKRDLFCVFLKPASQPIVPGGGLYE